MSRLLDEVKTDLNFIKGHTLQPKWFKVLKVFILLGVCVGYYRLFGLAKTAAFFAIFFTLMLLVHMVYRVKTNTWKQTWLDFRRGREWRDQSQEHRQVLLLGRHPRRHPLVRHQPDVVLEHDTGPAPIYPLGELADCPRGRCAPSLTVV